MTVTRMFTGKRCDNGSLYQFKPLDKIKVIKRFRSKVNVEYKGMMITVEAEQLRKCAR